MAQENSYLYLIYGISSPISLCPGFYPVQSINGTFPSLFVIYSLAPLLCSTVLLFLLLLLSPSLFKFAIFPSSFVTETCLQPLIRTKELKIGKKNLIFK